MFTVEDYLAIHNGAFGKNIAITDINTSAPILQRLRKLNGGKDFNHYSLANYLAKNISSITLSGKTKDNFEKLFKEVNKLL